MKRITSAVILAALTIGAAVKWGSASSVTGPGDLLEVLPDGTAVAIIDFQKIAGSSLWATINAQEKLKSAINKAQSEIADLGVKLSDVHTIAVVFPAASMNNPTVAVSGGFEQNELLARLRAGGKVKLTSDKYKDFDIYRVESLSAMVGSKEPPNETGRASAKPTARANMSAVNKNETSLVFHDAHTIVAGSLEAVRASVDVRMGARASIAQNAKLAEALAQNPAAAIRFAVAFTPSMTSALQSSELPMPDFSSVKLIFGAVDVSSGIDLNVTLRNDTAEHAKSIAERLNGLLAMARGYLGSMSDPKMAQIVEALKSVNIISADVDVKVTGSVPMDLLNNLLSSSGRKGQ